MYFLSDEAVNLLLAVVDSAAYHYRLQVTVLLESVHECRSLIEHLHCLLLGVEFI